MKTANPLPSQATRESLVAVIAEIQNYMTCFGISGTTPARAPSSIFFLSLCRANDFPESLSLFEDDQLIKLHQILKSKWEALPLNVQNQRVIVNSYLVLLNTNWGNEIVLKWIKEQNTPFTELSYEQLASLSKSLELIYKRRFPSS